MTSRLLQESAGSLARWQSAVWLATAAGLVFVAGIAAGYFLASIPFRRSIGYWDVARTLGTMADAQRDRQVRAAAYLDPDRAHREMDGYIWVPRNVPAPFVGVLPEVSDGIQPGGYRAARNPAAPSGPGVLRVFLTGGSTAFSSGAPSLDGTIGGRFAQGLRARLRSSVEVFTLANPAWASTQERIAVENEISERRPDVVVAFTGVNDAHWSFLGRDTLAFRTYWDQLVYDLTEHAYALAGRRSLVDPIDVSDEPIDVVRVAARFAKNARLAHQALVPTEAKYVVVLQPTLFTTTKVLTERERALLDSVAERRREYFANVFRAYRATIPLLRSAGVDVLDLSDVFSGRPAGEEIFLDSYHFGDRGNRLIGEALARELGPLLAAEVLRAGGPG